MYNVFTTNSSVEPHPVAISLSLDQERTITDAVYSRLRRDILEGVLRPGQRLDQGRICREFGISRTPLREVLRRLDAEGLVVIRSHRGAEVALLSVRDIEEFYDLRAVLEGYAVRLAAERATPESVARFRRYLAEMAEAIAAGEHDRLLEIHRSFHNALCSEAGNLRLTELVVDLRSRCEWFRRANIEVPHRARASLSEHQAIVDAYAAGDGPGVEALVQRNLRNTARTVVGHLLQHRQMPEAEGPALLDGDRPTPAPSAP